MRKLTTITLLCALALLPVPAALAQALQVDATADCQGWSAMATLTFPAGVFFSDLDYSVVLTDGNGAEVDRFEWAGQVNRFENPVLTKMYDEIWAQPLNSSFSASVAFHFLGEEFAQSFDLACGPVEPEPVIEPCHHTYKYWRRHPDQWPVDEMMVCGEMYSQSQLLNMMSRRSRFHRAFNLVRHLVAARLNVLNGTDDSIVPVIEAAEAFLMQSAAERGCHWRGRSEARQLRRDLVEYNNLTCGEFGFDDDSHAGGRHDKTFAEEPMSFDGVKAMYR
jgi:hypothetical protein